MKSTSKQFTKPNSLSSTGRGNTLLRFCFLVLVSSLPEATKKLVEETLNDDVEDALQDVEDSEELDCVSSQTFPEFSQSQGQNVLRKCLLCYFGNFVLFFFIVTSNRVKF